METRMEKFKDVRESINTEYREACENILIHKLTEILELYKQYNPNGEYLGMYIDENTISVNNRYWSDDQLKPINKIVTLGEEDE